VPLSFKDVAEILKLIDASQCDEFVLELDGARLVIRRNTSGTASATFTPSERDTPITISGDGTTGASASTPRHERPATSSAPAARQSGNTDLTDVRAPMVGTFYRRPSPQDPPFVEEGTPVKKGDPLCLIEVMKLFTTIEAPADGTVASICAEDGSLVEFNQLLMQIKA